MSSSTSPCAACKFLRRKCTQECVFAPYFPPDQPTKFANVHKIFGASNVAKLLNDLSASQREDAVNSLAYEADARLKNPVYGCVGFISVLQQKLKAVQYDLFNAKKELASYIGPSAMAPMLHLQQPGLFHQYPNPNLNPNNNTSSSNMLAPYNAQLVIREPQHHQQHQQQQYHNHQQMLEAQQLAAMVAAREQQEMMLRGYEQQQQQQVQHQQQQHELMGFNSSTGGFDVDDDDDQAGQVVVTATGFNAMGGGGGGGGAIPPSLALGSFDHSYQIQQESQDHHAQLHQQPQILLHQPPEQQRKSGSEEGRSVGPSC